MNKNQTEMEKLREQWRQKWPEALALWSKYTRLSEPRYCLSEQEEISESLVGSFAMIRLTDQGVVISLKQVLEFGLGDFPLEIMAHEIGHHVYCPADLGDQGRMLARIRRALPTKEALAPFISNLYSDLLINDRLQRNSSLQMSEVYRTLGHKSQDRMWTFYMRIYEVLWGLGKGSLASGDIDKAIEADAFLAAKLIRSFAKDWLRGAGRFAAVCFRYLLPDDGKELQELLRGMWDMKEPGDGGFPDGLAEVDLEEEEEGDDEFPIFGSNDSLGRPSSSSEEKKPKRRRSIIDYKSLVRSLGVKLDDRTLTKKYYRELALPYLVPFPMDFKSNSMEPMPEGLEPWDIGDSVADLDWLESQFRSPHLIPGYTTVQRNYGQSPGEEINRKPLDLYIGIDCSGSMPNPQQQLSYPVLAGTILALSALRVGAKIKLVLSGEPGTFHATDGFISDENEILQVLTGYLGTGTYFDIHRLRETFLAKDQRLKSSHIVVISDIDIFTALDKEDGGVSGWSVAKASAERAGGGATYVLHMPEDYYHNGVERMRQDHWNVFPVLTQEDLVEFARKFSKTHYGTANR